jgi:hypothetical protein
VVIIEKVTEDFLRGKEIGRGWGPCCSKVCDWCCYSVHHWGRWNVRMQTIQGVLRVWKRQLQRDRVLLLGPRGCLSSERALSNIELDVLANGRTLYRRR